MGYFSDTSGTGARGAATSATTSSSGGTGGGGSGTSGGGTTTTSGTTQTIGGRTYVMFRRGERPSASARAAGRGQTFYYNPKTGSYSTQRIAGQVGVSRDVAIAKTREKQPGYAPRPTSKVQQIRDIESQLRDPGLEASKKRELQRTQKKLKREEEVEKIRAFEQAQKPKAIGLKDVYEPTPSGGVTTAEPGAKRRGRVTDVSPGFESLVGLDIEVEHAKDITAGRISKQELERAPSFTIEEQERRYGGVIFPTKKEEKRVPQKKVEEIFRPTTAYGGAAIIPVTKKREEPPRVSYRDTISKDMITLVGAEERPPPSAISGIAPTGLPMGMAAITEFGVGIKPKEDKAQLGISVPKDQSFWTEFKETKLTQPFKDISATVKKTTDLVSFFRERGEDLGMKGKAIERFSTVSEATVGGIKKAEESEIGMVRSLTEVRGKDLLRATKLTGYTALLMSGYPGTVTLPKVGEVAVVKHLLYQETAATVKETGLGKSIKKWGEKQKQEAREMPEGARPFGKALVGTTAQFASFPIEHPYLTSTSVALGGWRAAKTTFETVFLGVAAYKGIIKPTFGKEEGIDVKIPFTEKEMKVFEKTTYSYGVGEALPYVGIAEVHRLGGKKVKIKFGRGKGQKVPPGTQQTGYGGTTKQGRPSYKPPKGKTSIDISTRAEYLRGKVKSKDVPAWQRQAAKEELIVISRREFGDWTPDWMPKMGKKAQVSISGRFDILESLSKIGKGKQETGLVVPQRGVVPYTPPRPTFFPVPLPTTSVVAQEFPVTKVDYPVATVDYPITKRDFPIIKRDYPITKRDYGIAKRDYPLTVSKRDIIPSPKREIVPEPTKELLPPSRKDIVPKDKLPPTKKGKEWEFIIGEGGLGLPPPPLPFGWIPTGGGAGVFGRGFGRRVSKERAFGYVPDIMALVTGEKGRKPTPIFGGIYTGQERRPIADSLSGFESVRRVTKRKPKKRAKPKKKKTTKKKTKRRKKR